MLAFCLCPGTVPWEKLLATAGKEAADAQPAFKRHKGLGRAGAGSSGGPSGSVPGPTTAAGQGGIRAPGSTQAGAPASHHSADPTRRAAVTGSVVAAGAAAAAATGQGPGAAAVAVAVGQIAGAGAAAAAGQAPGAAAVVVAVGQTAGAGAAATSAAGQAPAAAAAAAVAPAAGQAPGAAAATTLGAAGSSAAAGRDLLGGARMLTKGLEVGATVEGDGEDSYEEGADLGAGVCEAGEGLETCMKCKDVQGAIQSSSKIWRILTSTGGPYLHWQHHGSTYCLRAPWY